jgi:putative transposase
MENRQIRGYAILASGVEPKQLDKYKYKVASQNGNGSYIVERSSSTSYGARWTCTCPDFQYRNLKCKHIHAVELWQQLKGQADVQIVKTVTPKVEIKTVLCCPYCKSEKVVKNGSRKTQTQTKTRYLCKDCKKTFIDDKVFEKIKATPEILTTVLDLYFKGVSLRKIVDHLQQIHGLKVSPSTVYKWIIDYMTTINHYTETLKPSVGGMWHTDEMKVKVKGEWRWLWNTIDYQTRYMLANNMTKERYTEDADKIFKKAKKTAGRKPHLVVTDGLQSYKQAFKNEFGSWKQEPFPKHLAGVGIRDDRSNNVIERYHGSVRERDKVMRGMKTDRTAKILHKGFKDYYNFIRIHQELGTTPAQMAGIEALQQQNRWMELLKRSKRQERI